MSNTPPSPPPSPKTRYRSILDLFRKTIKYEFEDHTKLKIRRAFKIGLCTVLVISGFFLIVSHLKLNKAQKNSKQEIARLESFIKEEVKTIELNTINESKKIRKLIKLQEERLQVENSENNTTSTHITGNTMSTYITGGFHTGSTTYPPDTTSPSLDRIYEIDSDGNLKSTHVVFNSEEKSIDDIVLGMISLFGAVILLLLSYYLFYESHQKRLTREKESSSFQNNITILIAVIPVLIIIFWNINTLELKGIDPNNPTGSQLILEYFITPYHYIPPIILSGIFLIFISMFRFLGNLYHPQTNDSPESTIAKKFSLIGLLLSIIHLGGSLASLYALYQIFQGQ